MSVDAFCRLCYLLEQLGGLKDTRNVPGGRRVDVALKDVVKQGWKCENDFRTGYLGVLEQDMKKLFPSSDIKTDPHIQSKIHVWKKTYGSLVGMLGRSGFGWNDATNMVVVDDDVWDNYIKIDPFVKNMRLRSFPFYPAWCEPGVKIGLRETVQNDESSSKIGSGKKRKKKGLIDLDARYIESIDRFVDRADMRLEMMSKTHGI
ncbi:UNVERIFIED_CONTAM: hypothetical protein Sradi_0671100 [Sesamum radiatum]|uniref:Myb/SANT-like domain-containing protein n=1 Tax=Sesamum radiatum TaxID=300843 RepID=A0AAW2VRN0_SESRA